MQEELTRVDLYGYLPQLPLDKEHRCKTELVIKRNENGDKTYLVHCLETGKILIKFTVMERP